ncbi:hypothetical protein U758_06825 [Streptococcus mitis 27/7]|uniref:hypothetical protein n=1 Tax=Streptococcus mitis TaxID=28037 RepID=UPI0003D357A1|nr:hypothetical protein [Streptococcus mitis]ETD97917.1 hypothetical protein U758_06825 [Streptococcus mitis 27/7]
MKKYLKNMVPIGTIDKNPVYFDKKDSSLYIVRKKTSFWETAGSSLIMILYVIIGRVNSKYYLTILGRYQFLMIGILISFIIAFVVCYVTYHRERQVEKLQLEEKAMRDFVLRERKNVFFTYLSLIIFPLIIIFFANLFITYGNLPWGVVSVLFMTMYFMFFYNKIFQRGKIINGLYKAYNLER